jgi:hypothetical protein
VTFSPCGVAEIKDFDAPGFDSCCVNWMSMSKRQFSRYTHGGLGGVSDRQRNDIVKLRGRDVATEMAIGDSEPLE